MIKILKYIFIRHCGKRNEMTWRGSPCWNTDTASGGLQRLAFMRFALIIPFFFLFCLSPNAYASLDLTKVWFKNTVFNEIIDWNLVIRWDNPGIILPLKTNSSNVWFLEIEFAMNANLKSPIVLAYVPMDWKIVRDPHKQIFLETTWYFEKYEIDLNILNWFKWNDIDNIQIFFAWKKEVAIKSIDLKPIFTTKSLLIKVKNFLEFDRYYPSTINLLYWPSISYDPANPLFVGFSVFWFFIITLILIYKRKKQFILYYCFIFFMILCSAYDLRMWTEILNYYFDDYKSYISNEVPEREFRDRGKFYWFLEYIKWIEKEEFSEEKEINFYSSYNWPFLPSAKYFMYPKEITYKDMSPRVHIFFRFTNFDLKDNKEIIIDWNSLWEGTFHIFDEYSFIFIKD